MRAVVTGGAGFIGSNVVDALVGRGTEVLVVDDLGRGTRENLAGALAAGAELAVLDVRDGARVGAAFREFRPEVVFHLAAQIDVRASMADPGHDASVNVLGSIAVFRAAADCGARRVVNTSTGGAIYGDARTVPTPETEPVAPLSAYGLGKRTAEEYGRWFRSTRGLDVVTLRYGNVYGPRQDPAGEAGVVARFCDDALAGRTPVVFGDGAQTRDYVFVGDVVAANLVAAGSAGRHDCYNIGTGTEVSVLELLDAVAAATGTAPAPRFEPARAGEVRRSCLDVTRARRELRLPPTTALRDGLAATAAWIAARPGAPAER